MLVFLLPFRASGPFKPRFAWATLVLAALCTLSFFQTAVRPVGAAERVKADVIRYWTAHRYLEIPSEWKPRVGLDSSARTPAPSPAVGVAEQTQLNERILTFPEVERQGLMHRMAFRPALGLVQPGLLAHPFLELSLLRLLGFLLLLYFLGPLLEEAVGGLPFLTLVLAGSTTAVVAQTVLSGSNAPIFGVDGMIAAMMGALMLHFAIEAVELSVVGWFLLWGKRGSVRIPAALITLGWAVMQAVMYMQQEVSRAHIFGQLAGFGFGFVGAALVKLVRVEAAHEVAPHAAEAGVETAAHTEAETAAQPQSLSGEDEDKEAPDAKKSVASSAADPIAAAAGPEAPSPAVPSDATDSNNDRLPISRRLTPQAGSRLLAMGIPAFARALEDDPAPLPHDAEPEPEHVPTPMTLAEEVSLAEAELKAEDPIGLQRAERLLTQQLNRNHREELLQVMTLCQKLNPLDLLPVTAFRLAAELEESPEPLRSQAERYYAAAGKHPNAMAARALVRAAELRLEANPDRVGIQEYLADLERVVTIPADLTARVRALRGEPRVSLEVPLVETRTLQESLIPRRIPSILQMPVVTAPLKSATEPKIVRGRLLEVNDHSLRLESENGSQHSLSLKHVVAVGVGMMPRPTADAPRRSVVVTDLVVVAADGKAGPGVVRLESTSLRLPSLYPGVPPSEAYRRFLAHVMIHSGANALGEMEGVFQGKYPRFADEVALNASLYAPTPIQPAN